MKAQVYINKNHLLNTLMENQEFYGDDYTLEDALHTIREFKIDYAVVSGNWIDVWDKETDTSVFARCECCERLNRRPLGHYCRWCGALMVTEQKGDELKPSTAKAENNSKSVNQADFEACRNELCLRCGQYKNSHLGACSDCRWRPEKWRRDDD